MLGAKLLTELGTSEEEMVKMLDADVQEIFSTMVGGEVLLQETTEAPTRFKDTVSAMVGFAGCYNGMVAINTPHNLALKFAGQMLGMEPEECADDMIDALGEIANMIGGSFKHHFVKDGLEVKLSTPSVISGDEYQMNVCSLPDSMTLQFSSGDELFSVTLYLESGN